MAVQKSKKKIKILNLKKKFNKLKKNSFNKKNILRKNNLNNIFF
jgi:hypothetical protein